MTRVDASDAVVFIFAHVGHVVGLLAEELEVEEVIREERAVDRVCPPVWGTGPAVEAEFLALAHAVDECLADELTGISVGLLTKSRFDDARAKISELALVVHERGDAALLVPDEEVLLGHFGVVDSKLELLQGKGWPRSAWLISFDHLVSLWFLS